MKPAKDMTPEERLDYIKGNCIIEGSCWVWQGHHNGSGIPKVRNESGRRLVWKLARTPLGPKQLISNKCGCLSCLNPDHLTVRSKSNIAKKAYSPAMRLKRQVSNALVARRLDNKINMDIARAIRASDEKQQVLADRHGLCRSMVSKIQRGEAWKELVNPWNGLAAL